MASLAGKEDPASMSECVAPHLLNHGIVRDKQPLQYSLNTRHPLLTDVHTHTNVYRVHVGRVITEHIRWGRSSSGAR